MATTPVQDQLYPFSTEDNKAIPLDIIRPVALIKSELLAAGNTPITIPTDWKVASFYCPTGCYIEFAAATMPIVPINGVAYANVLFVPPNCVVTATVLPGVANINPVKSGASYIVMQQIQKWAGLALRRQASSI